MTTPSKRRTAIDCLRRGALATRANWALVPLALLQGLLMVALVGASFVPFVVVLGGLAALRGSFRDPQAVEGWLQGLGATAAEHLPALGLALVASLVVGLAAVALWGWFEGGIVGTLVAADRQAHPEAQNRPGAVGWFRTFSGRDFAGWGGRYMWRFFWFFHLYVTCALLLMLLALLLALGAGFGYRAWGVGAAVGIGCGGALPFVFLVLVFALWFLAALPAVVVSGGKALAGAGLGLRVVGRRLGASLLIFVVLLVASLVVGLGMGVAQTMVNLMLRHQLVIWGTLYAALALVQWLVSSLINVFVLAAFTSLVVSEHGEARG